MIFAAAQDTQKVFADLLEHLLPHHYSWAPVLKVAGIDLSPTNAVINMVLAALGVFLLFFLAARRGSHIPRGVQNFAEASMDFIKDNIVYAVMSPQDGRVWGPFIITIFFFILFMNLIGIVPIIGFTPTANIWVTAVLAFGTWFMAIAVGMAKNGPLRFWKLTLVPAGLPPARTAVGKALTKALLVFMILIETISQIARPITLAVRLFANMLADHLILLVFLGFIFISAGIGSYFVAPVAIFFEFVFYVFAVFVAIIQAAIFAFLAALYMNDSLHPGH